MNTVKMNGMKRISIIVITTALVAGITDVDAQGYRRRPANSGGGAGQTTTNPPAGNSNNQQGGNTSGSTGTNTNSQQGGSNQSGNNTSGGENVTYTFGDTSSNNMTVKPSLRNNYAFERNMVRSRKPLEYDHIREDDALFSEFIWRQIDAREKMNQTFLYQAKDDNGDQRFFSILIEIIKNDSITAFAPIDDRFTTPLTRDEILKQMLVEPDTVDVPDPVSGIINKVITMKPKINIDSVYTYRLKEVVLFDKESSRFVFRTIGIAPIIKEKRGNVLSERVLFWLYYPDIRTSLARFEVYNPKNFSARMTWEDLFESRYYSSYIIKTSMNNPKDLTLRAMIRNPLFELLEGEKIKEKIFNYEQGLWEY